MTHIILPFDLPDFKLNLPELLPSARPSVASQVEQLTAHYLEEWWGGSENLPAQRRSYTLTEQLQNEQRAARLLDGLQMELKRLAKGADDKEETRRRILDGLFAFARRELGVAEEELDWMRSAGFLELAQDFAKEARRFDPHIRGEDIYQASRNVLSAGYMQFLLDIPVHLTPSIFAYSMLYPYSDNLLDDASIPLEERKAFNRRFRQRLEGQVPAEKNRLEGRIWELIAMVEAQYPRREYPQVYESLLAIHSAQGRSLLQRRPGAGPYELDVMGISIEKGGASTLADGYLVAGDLSDEQAAACFGYGAFTQLMDDLEDAEEDRKDGYQTIFSQLAGHWKLDGVTARAMRFAGGIIQRMEAFPNRQAARLTDNMELAVQTLFAFSAAGHASCYSRSFLEELQRHQPVRFAFAEKQRRRLQKQGLGTVEIMLALTGV